LEEVKPPGTKTGLVPGLFGGSRAITQQAGGLFKQLASGRGHLRRESFETGGDGTAVGGEDAGILSGHVDPTIPAGRPTFCEASVK
jgi:hypothetical protein